MPPLVIKDEHREVARAANSSTTRSSAPSRERQEQT
jgi:hypothetical protein